MSSYPPPYSMPDNPPMSSTRLNYQQHPVPSPYIAQTTTVQIPTPIGPLPSNNPCKCVSALLCILLTIACIFYTIVLFIELGKLPCKSQISPIVILGVISTIGLTLMALFSLGYLSMMCAGLFRALVIVAAVISFLSALGFSIYVWVVQNRHLGVCYIKGGFAPILIALGFLEAGLAVVIPLLVTI